MAVMDDQLDQLVKWSEEIGRDGVLHDPRDYEIIDAVFDRAEIEDMRTQDEFNSPLAPEDLRPQDERDIVAAWEKGSRIEGWVA